MTTEIIYQVIRVTGPNEGYQMANHFTSEMAAKNYALNIKDSEAQEYKIQSTVITTSILDVFTVPAHVPTLEEIANEIIAGSYGSFYLDWGDDFERLEEPARTQVEDMVNEAITSCDCCGWHCWNVESMEYFDDSGETLCYKCADDRLTEEEEDESDED